MTNLFVKPLGNPVSGSGGLLADIIDDDNDFEICCVLYKKNKRNKNQSFLVYPSRL